MRNSWIIQHQHTCIENVIECKIWYGKLCWRYISSKKYDRWDTNCLFERTGGLDSLEMDQVFYESDRKYWSERQTDGLPGNKYLEGNNQCSKKRTSYLAVGLHYWSWKGWSEREIFDERLRIKAEYFKYCD